MKRTGIWLALALLLFTAPGLALAAAGEGAEAALLYTDMTGVDDEERDALWGYTRKVLAQYYALLPEERVRAVEDKARAAGCEGVACMEAVRAELGVPVALHLRHIDEGYFNQLYLTELTEAGAVEKHYNCSRCSHREFQTILGRLTRKFEKH